jgi:hypothetical protein
MPNAERYRDTEAGLYCILPPFRTQSPTSIQQRPAVACTNGGAGLRSHGGHARHGAGDAGGVPRHGGADPLRSRRRRPGRAQPAGGGQLSVHQPRLGTRRDDGMLRGRGRLRRAPESGCHHRTRDPSRVSLAEGRALCARADGRRLCRRRSGLRDLRRGADAFRWRRATGARSARDSRHLGHVSAAVPEHVSRRIRGPDRGHGHSDGRHSRHHRCAQLAPALGAGAAHRRSPRRRHRHGLRLQRRVRHQPGA